MPTRMYQLPMAFASLDEVEGEEMFLLYTPGFKEGPQIQRDGKREPWMIDPDNPRRDIVDPLEQRKGVWFVNQKIKSSLKVQVKKELKVLRRDLNETTDKGRKKGLAERIAFRERFLGQIDDIGDYQRVFTEIYGSDYELIGMQGSGNLTMNEWYVAYVDSAFSQKYNNGSAILALPADKTVHPPREYTCLVKWKEKRSDRGGRHTIEELYFNFYRKRVLLKATNEDITDQIEFAVYGTRILEEGEISDFREVVRQLADVRHAFRLPNVNPADGGRPRQFFGKYCWGDVWFGEAEMLSNLALRRAAISEPVIFDCQFRNMGMNTEELALRLEALGYRRRGQLEVPNTPGDFRLRPDRDNWIEIFLHRNVYSYTMIGVGVKGEIASLAVAGLAGRVGQTLEAATHNILSYMTNIQKAEKVNALLIDQGEDVFQLIKKSAKKSLDSAVPITRGQLRAVFAFGKRK